MSEGSNLFRGRRVDDEEFKSLFYRHYQEASFWCQPPVSHTVLFAALEKVNLRLHAKDELYLALCRELNDRSDVREEDIDTTLMALMDFIDTDQLRIKLFRELGTEFPFELKRIDPRKDQFESWYPLGVLVHVTPNNSPLLGVLGVLEGLMSGNVNVLKLARKDTAFATVFYEALCRSDRTGTLANYLFIAKVRSSEKAYLKDVLSVADVVSAWGNEESVKSIREMAPKGARIVEWGHKISFAYVSAATRQDQAMLRHLAFEICNNEQAACSSPQCVFVENADMQALNTFAADLAQALAEVSPAVPRTLPSLQETAELTVVSEQVRLAAVDGKSSLRVASDRSWRIFVEDTPGLNASPLFRSIWVKPMPVSQIVANLRPLKMYLQTVGLSANHLEVESLTKTLLLAGVQRVRALGDMTDGYMGEPHDGVYALERYCQRVSYCDSLKQPRLQGKMSFEEESPSLIDVGKPIMEKSDFQALEVDEAYSDLFFYSGGSSGEPKLSIFTYDDYHRQMELAAEGLFAAGLDPRHDKCMNLFYAGNLYGGFTSFFTVLEKLHAIQFPMGASFDFDLVGKTIVKNKVDTLLGMPSYIIQLFQQNDERLRTYRGIKKIFYGGEHFSDLQKKHLMETYGVSLIRSATYGTVDAGPLGYQCLHCEGSVHHLHHRLHDLEIVALDEDRPVADGEVGRLLFTSKVRHGQRIDRYAIGDVGRWVDGACLCGRYARRFELLGRHGDVFRIGATFLSYQKFQKLVMDYFQFAGALQLHLHGGTGTEKDKTILLLEALPEVGFHAEQVQNMLLNNYKDLKESVQLDQVMDFVVEILPRDKMSFTPTTGKLRTVVDHRFKA